MNEIKLIRLISGHEVLAKVVDSTPGILVLNQPVALVYQQSGPGQMSVGFAPFMPYAEGDIPLERAVIAAIATPKDQMNKEYVRATSGIVIASNTAV